MPFRRSSLDSDRGCQKVVFRGDDELGRRVLGGDDCTGQIAGFYRALIVSVIDAKNSAYAKGPPGPVPIVLATLWAVVWQTCGSACFQSRPTQQDPDRP